MSLQDTLFRYKNEIMKAICTHEHIVQLVLDSKDATAPKPELAYQHIYPFEYIPDTVNHGNTFICFDVDVPMVMDRTFYAPALFLWVFTHKSKLRLPEGGVRTDALISELDELLNGNRFFGLGELSLQSVGRFSPISDYQGRIISYHAKDFNRVSAARRSALIPGNKLEEI